MSTPELAPTEPEQEFLPPRPPAGLWQKAKANPQLYVPAAIVALFVVIGVVIHLVRSQTAAPASAQVAAIVGADSCDNSGYGFVSQITGKQTTIYNCAFSAVGGFKGSVQCVTYENGIANVANDEVRIAFANSLNGKPGCLGG